MKYAFFLSALCILPAIQPAWGQIPDGFRPLFNGQDLSGWHGDNPHSTAQAKPDQRCSHGIAEGGAVGVERLDPAGEPFNPDFHQAMTMQSRPDLAPSKPPSG